jgi:hypothetical protein
VGERDDDYSGGLSGVGWVVGWLVGKERMNEEFISPNGKNGTKRTDSMKELHYGLN